MTRSHSSAPRRPPPIPLIAGVTLLAILTLILVVLLATRGPGTAATSDPPAASGPASTLPSGSPATSAGAAPSSPASLAPSSGTGLAVDPPADILPAGAMVEVAVDALRIRRGPSTEDPVVATASRGEVLYILPWSLAAISGGDGLQWYEVTYAAGHDTWPLQPEGESQTGFAAGRDGDGALVELREPRCPATVDMEALAAITPWERLACIGDSPITLEGTYGCGVCDALALSGRWEPAWLASYLVPRFEVLWPAGRVQQPDVERLVLGIPPDGGPGDGDKGNVLRITGHFDDPRAADCEMVFGEDESGRVDDRVAEWHCREIFVVDTWELIGPDDAYPTP